MQNFTALICLLIVTLIEVSSSFKQMNDGVQSILSPSPLTSERNGPEDLSKSFLLSSVSRDRRASISRPYFQQWRGSQEENRLGANKLPAYANHVGKRTYTVDTSAPMAALFDHSSKQPTDIVYEDSATICYSRLTSDAWAEEAMDKLRAQQHHGDAQDQPIKSARSFTF